MAGEAEIRLRERLSRLRSLPLLRGARVSEELKRLERQLERIEAGETDEDIWRQVELARHPDRPYALDYVERLIEDFVELHGDRARAEDPAVVTGIGRFAGRTIALIGHQKGDPPRGARERQRRNFGMTYPEGYRKAMRAMEIAERHGFPLISLVDTPGAYPGVAAEQHGQGGAIARSQALLARLTVPTIACIIGEGGSGGAIAIALADRVLMQEHAMYSVISPEGCAAILWRDGAEKVKAAAALKPDALHCVELGAVDAIVPEPEGGAQEDYDQAARLLGAALESALDDVGKVPGEELRRRRRDRFRSLGIYGVRAGSETAVQPRR
ncbi:MAG TPA: acetyl-CoA carboxylase carboxyltransferase subunit alpha [Gaiellaceae bacterium]|nr:acetyl-CoA carboxylase carboxyltransferase subunit alpha [Gaiellaceae bacterium]